MSCDKCRYFKIVQEPLRGIGGLYDMGRVRCEKHDLIKDFSCRGQFKNLTTCKDFKKVGKEIV